MNNVDPKAFEYALSQISNGFVFEEFAQHFLASVLGYEFEPAGRVKDRGIDGLQHVFQRKHYERMIYQVSTERDAAKKLENTITKLAEHQIEYDTLCYITTRRVTSHDTLIDELYTKFSKPVRIWDIQWLSARVNSAPGTINAYTTFILPSLHEFAQPGKSYVFGELVKDPRVFVFLRQQWDKDSDTRQLDSILADTLILLALEGTDPDKGLLKSVHEIKKDITARIAFEPKSLFPMIDKRLRILSEKPRQINHHTGVDAYCLPFETRVAIQERNLLDARLHQEFQTDAEAILEKHLAHSAVSVKDCLSLVESAINRIYYQQGLEFSDFILKGQNQEAFEKDLQGTISETVDSSSVIPPNREVVKSALMMAIREMSYIGSPAIKEFLRKLSSTYMMMFLLHCDPKLAMYFQGLASRLRLYVCTSILVPAMSEYLLDEGCRRHWNLLKGARDAGVRLIVNKTIVGELAAHFRSILSRYELEYAGRESVYEGDEIKTLYVDEIMIRAFFYARMRGKATSFDGFIDNFVSPDMSHPEDELIDWLREEFGVEYIEDDTLGVSLDKDEVNRLYEAVKKHKSASPKAMSDAKVILTIYALRRRGNESGTRDISGYKTWWLSTDTVTQKAVNITFGDKYAVSCYMRPDFLYNFISLAPRTPQVADAYRSLFPTLVGVNISFHLPHQLISCVHKYIEEHKTKNQARLGAIIGQLGDKLKTEPTMRSRAAVELFLDQMRREL